jgi:hypothetical protein
MAEDRGSIVDALNAATPPADDRGVISAFGLKLMEAPAGLWISFFAKLIKAGRTTDPDSRHAGLFLENTAARAAYHALNAVLPGTAGDGGPEAVLRAGFALAAAWGCADAEITALQLPHEMTVRAKTYAEAEISATLNTDAPSAFAFKGVCRALMDLACGAPFPGGFGAYACRQTFAVETGDPYGEFIVARAGT